MGRGSKGTFLGIRNTCYLDSSIDGLNVQWVKAELHELEECVLFSPTPYDCVLEIISCGSCPHSTHKPPLNNRKYVLIKIMFVMDKRCIIYELCQWNGRVCHILTHL